MKPSGRRRSSKREKLREKRGELPRGGPDAGSDVKYDLVGKTALETGLPPRGRRDSERDPARNLRSLQAKPEEFIIKASGIINEQKATVIIEHVAYSQIDESYSADIFTEPS
jgi:type III restriction enzyme